MRKISIGLIVLLVAAGLLVVPGSAQANGIILQPKYGRTFLTSPGPTWLDLLYVADVENYSLDDRARVHLWGLGAGGANQVWYGYTLQGYPSDQIVFINLNSGKCLDKSMDNGNNNGAAVYQYTCSYAANQLWRVVLYTSTTGVRLYHIISVASGQCLDVQDKVYANGAPVQVWSCNSSGWNQGWYLYAA